jgi:hypothetical protein
MAASRLVELGQQAFVEVAAGVARGEPLVKCQLLASKFYEALKRELRQMPSTNAKRTVLLAAIDRCDRVATAGIGPGVVLRELESIIALLQSDLPTPPSTRGGPRPFLRVIEGGLSSSRSSGATFSSSAPRLERDAP